MKFLLLFLLLIISCGKIPDQQIISLSKNIDPKLAPYLSRFELEAEAYNVQVNSSKLTMVISTELLSDVAGDCLAATGHPELGQVIRISSSIIDNKLFGIDNVENVVFHELGHCLLGREHKTETVLTTDGYHIYDSIMNSGSGNDSNYINNRKAMIHELFTGMATEPYTLIPDKSQPSQFPFDYYLQFGLK